MTYRELFWMSEGRQRLSWMKVTSLVRIMGMSHFGKDTPLKAFVPARFVPKVAKPKAAEYSPEARRQIVGAFIDVLHGRKPNG